MLKEEVTFDKVGVTSLDWASIRCCASPSIPNVVPVVVQRLEEQATGAGEEVMGATAAAIANAFFDATGRAAAPVPDDARAREGRAVGEDVTSVKLVARMERSVIRGKRLFLPIPDFAHAPSGLRPCFSPPD